MSLSKIISDESFFGRGNDTQMRYVDGELSHVNKQEAELIDKYGKKGEQIVKEHGSGTINPYTGRREYFLDPVSLSAYAAIGTLALGAIKEISGGVAKEKKAKLDQEMADNTIDSIEAEGGALDLLEEDYQARQDIQTSKFLDSRDDLAFNVGTKLEDLSGKFDIRRSQADLAFSSIDKASKRSEEILREDANRRQRGMFTGLQENLLNLTRWYQGEKGKLDTELQRQEYQKDIAKQNEDSWYLGKNVIKGLQGIIPGGSTGGWGW